MQATGELHKQVGRPSIPETDPWLADRLKRKPFAKALEDIIFSTQQPLVVCVDGAWGTGKTHLLEIWQRDLEKRYVACVSFNAWNFDYADDPLVALITQLETGLSDFRKRGGSSTWKAGLKRVKDLGARMLPALAPVAASAVIVAAPGDALTPLATTTAVATAEVTKRAKGLLTPSSLGLRNLATQRFDSLRELVKLEARFTAELEKLATSLAASEEGPGLVVFVDDLDRCRPTFAIETLERLKHFFSVPRVAFILAADRAQLGCALRATYGQGIDEDNYLRRFFNLTVKVPTPPYKLYAEFLFKELSLGEVFGESAAHVELHDLGRDGDAWLLQREIPRKLRIDPASLFKESLAGTAQARGLSLRAMNQAAELAALIARRYRHAQPNFAAALLPVIAVAENVAIGAPPGRSDLLLDLFVAKRWGPETLQTAFPDHRNPVLDAVLLAAAALTGREDILRISPRDEKRLLTAPPGGSHKDVVLPIVIHLLQREWPAVEKFDPFHMLATRARELGRDLFGAPEDEQGRKKA